MAAAATTAARREAAARTAPPKRAPSRGAPPGPTAPPRTAPRRAPARRPGGQLIPLAVGTANAVGRLPDSSLMVRLTRGRAWIAVLGVLLVGIVCLNVLALSLTATAGRVEQSIQALDQENSMLRGRDARKSGRIRHDAAGLGLSAATVDQVAYLDAGSGDVAAAAERLAAAETGQ